MHDGTLSRKVGSGLLGIALITLGIGMGGCAGSARPTAPPGVGTEGRSVTAADRAALAEADAQGSAQHAWCGYLQALYLRAATDATSWPRYEQCTEVRTMASPEMLHKTAECSLRALKAFPGDPFTSAYAEEVSRCGSAALDAVIVSDSEIAPFLATICGRMTTCGSIDYGECRDSLLAGLAPHLERAVGAINTRGRAELRACLKTVTCDELGGQITSCLEPIMDELLWLPG